MRKEQAMKGFGLMISNMGRESNNGVTKLLMLACFIEGRKMEKVDIE